MSNTNKNILITPNRGQEDNPTISFTGTSDSPINLKVLTDNTGNVISWEDASENKIFSFNANFQGNLFSVSNDRAIPSIDVNSNGTVLLAPYSGNVAIGGISPTEKLDITGNLRIGTQVNKATVSYTSNTNRVYTIPDSGQDTEFVMGAGTQTILGTKNFTGETNVNLLHLINSEATNIPAARLSLYGSYPGRLANRNPYFRNGVDGFVRYNNRGGNAVSISQVSDTNSPSASGNICRISYITPNTNGTSPGFGGVYIAIGRRTTLDGYGYIRGNRYLHKIIAKIPSGRSINFASNAYGTGGSFRWITSQAGTGNWQEYIGLQKIGNSGSFSSTGFLFITGGSNVSFTWDVAKWEFIGIDESVTTEWARTFSVGNNYTNSVGTVVCTTLTQTSDINLKKNITPIKNALDKVLQMRGVEYDRIDDDEHYIGLIAQEVESILPEVVQEGEYKAISYGNIVAVLVEAIKEQQEQIKKISDSINK